MSYATSTITCKAIYVKKETDIWALEMKQEKKNEKLRMSKIKPNLKNSRLCSDESYVQLFL